MVYVTTGIENRVSKCIAKARGRKDSSLLFMWSRSLCSLCNRISRVTDWYFRNETGGVCCVHWGCIGIVSECLLSKRLIYVFGCIL